MKSMRGDLQERNRPGYGGGPGGDIDIQRRGFSHLPLGICCSTTSLTGYRSPASDSFTWLPNDASQQNHPSIIKDQPQQINITIKITSKPIYYRNNRCLKHLTTNYNFAFSKTEQTQKKRTLSISVCAFLYIS